MIVVIEYSLFQRISLEEAANKRPRGLLPMMANRERLRPKGVFFREKWYIKRVTGWTPGRSLPVKTFVEYPPPPGKRQGEMAEGTKSFNSFSFLLD